MELSPIRHRDIYLCVDSRAGPKKLLWLSFQRKGHISLGFFDSQFTVPALIDSNGNTLDFAATHGMASVKNPHFTLHYSDVPAHFHLKSESGAVLCQGLVWSRQFPGEEISPWLRFVSNPLSELDVYDRAPNGRQVEIVRVVAPMEDCSIAIDIDFATPSIAENATASAGYFCWREVPLRAKAYCVPAQKATLGYEISN